MAVQHQHDGANIAKRSGQAAQRQQGVGKIIAARLKLSGPVLIGEGAGGDIYLDTALKPADRKRALDAALAAYRADPQVEAVFTKAQLARTPSPTAAPDKWTLIERARASFDAERSGDLVVLLKRNITPIADPSKGYVATHGSPWDYDRRVPILFWRPGARPNDRPEAIETVDIMPTLAAMIGLAIDAAKIDGHCLASAGVAACPPLPCGQWACRLPVSLGYCNACLFP